MKRQLDWSGAKHDFDQALRLEPNNAPVLEGRADARLALGSLDAAVTDYRLARQHGADGDRIAARPARLLERA
jgi:hypothetical protein